MRLPAALLLALALGTLLRLPYLDSGFRRDDHVMLALLRGEFAIQRSPFDLYWFSGRDRREMRVLRDSGYLPWWTAPDYRLAFLRPLSSGLLALDYRLFGADARGFQLHSLAWWALLLLGCALVLRRVLPPAAAVAALLFIAVDESAAGPLGWPSNRTALVSSSLGMLALWAHLRARQDGDRRAALLAPLFAFASVLGGEYALATLAYIPAYELFGARGAWRRRVGAAAPVLGLIGAYLVVRTWLGYGSRASGLYVGLLEAPGRYLANALARVPALAADLVLGVPAAWYGQGSPWRNELLRLRIFDAPTWQALPSWQDAHVALGLCALVLAAWLARVVARACGPDARALGWLLPGALLSLFAVVGALPSSRLLSGAELAAAALLSLALLASLTRLRRLAVPRRVWALLGVAAILLVHGGLAARRSALHARDYRVRAHAVQRWALSAELPDAAAGVDVLVLSAADLASSAYVPYIRARFGHPLPRSYRQLGGAQHPHRLKRIDQRTLELTVLTSDLDGVFVGSLQRSADRPFRAGQRIGVPGLTIEVLAVREGNPWRLRYRFDRPLEDPSLLFLQAEPDGLQRMTLPPIGAEVTLPAAVPPWPPGARTFL